MNWKDFIKTTEALVVIGGLIATVAFGKVFAIPTGIVYVLLNVPALWTKIKGWFGIS